MLNHLTFFMPMFPPYRNQSIDLQCKSIDWFLYEGKVGMKKVKVKSKDLKGRTFEQWIQQTIICFNNYL